MVKIHTTWTKFLQQGQNFHNAAWNQMKYYPGRPGKMNEPHTNKVYLIVPYTTMTQQFTVQTGCEYVWKAEQHSCCQGLPLIQAMLSCRPKQSVWLNCKPVLSVSNFFTVYRYCSWSNIHYKAVGSGPVGPVWFFCTNQFSIISESLQDV